MLRGFAFAVRSGVWCSRDVSDWLVQIQDRFAQYPSWVIAGAIGFVVVIALILIWKAMRMALIAFIVAVAVAGAWYVWENLGHRQPRRTAPEVPGEERGP